jgi:hypothetical protein
MQQSKIELQQKNVAPSLGPHQHQTKAHKGRDQSLAPVPPLIVTCELIEVRCKQKKKQIKLFAIEPSVSDQVIISWVHLEW